MNKFEVVTALDKLGKYYSVQETRIVQINVDHICSAYPITFEGWHPDGYMHSGTFELTSFSTMDGSEHIIFREWDEFDRYGQFFNPEKKKFNEQWVQ